MLENERLKLLKETMKQFNKDQKEEILFFGDEIENQEVISTGIPSIDTYLGGGVKRATHTIFWGDFSTGKTSLALQIIANAQKEDKICAYINLEKPVDNERFDILGVNRAELIRADCTKNAEQALTIIKQLCKAKVIDLIVIDSIQALSPKAENENKGKARELDEKTMAELARTMSEFCRRVNADIYRAKVGVIWIGQLRTNIGSFYSGAILSGGNALKFYAYQIVFMRKGQNSDAPVKKFKDYWIDPEDKLRFETVLEPIGFDAVFRMDKNNSSKAVREKTESHFPFLDNKGFVNEFKIDEEPKVRIDKTATSEQREIITKKLIEKGILKDNPFILLHADNRIIDDVMDIAKNPGQNHLEISPIECEKIITHPFNIDESVEIKSIDVTKEPKKQRGRPKKENKQ
jgi:protein RecA